MCDFFDLIIYESKSNRNHDRRNNLVIILLWHMSEIYPRLLSGTM